MDHGRHQGPTQIHSILQAEFDKAAEEAKTLPSSVTNDDKLKLYGLFKQATTGDVQGCETLPHDSSMEFTKAMDGPRAYGRNWPKSMASSVAAMHEWCFTCPRLLKNGHRGRRTQC